jgi:hypothetical protein
MMQVLGAYGKLSLVDGKRDFLQYVPPALTSLRYLLALEALNGFPQLISVVESIVLPDKFLTEL